MWDGFPGPWSGTNDGDPIVIYDELDDRWFASQFAVNTSDGSFWELVAVSETSDPLGAWYRYAFEFDYFNDYPKFGVWPNAYLGTFNYFNASATSYVGGGAVALDREAMINGDPDAEMIIFPINGSKYGILPADFDGTPPPADEPAWFAHINRTGDKKNLKFGKQISIGAIHYLLLIPCTTALQLMRSMLTLAPFHSLVQPKLWMLSVGN